jgi:hypothetical protein
VLLLAWQKVLPTGKRGVRRLRPQRVCDELRAQDRGNAVRTRGVLPKGEGRRRRLRFGTHSTEGMASESRPFRAAQLACTVNLPLIASGIWRKSQGDLTSR